MLMAPVLAPPSVTYKLHMRSQYPWPIQLHMLGGGEGDGKVRLLKMI